MLFSPKLLCTLTAALCITAVSAQFAHYPDYTPSIGSSFVPVQSFQQCEDLCQLSTACGAYAVTFDYSFTTGQSSARCNLAISSGSRAQLTSIWHYSAGLRDRACGDDNTIPSSGGLTANYCANSRQDTASPNYSVYNYHILAGATFIDSKPVPRATACQASCSALPTCQAYYAFFSANTPEAVTCVRLRISSTNYLRALGSFTGIKDQCADFANQYTPAQQAACYDSPPIMYASARARARRSIIRAPNNSLCTDGETSCPVKKIDGTLGSGSECVDLSLEVTSCGSCGYDCADHAAEGVLYAGCNQGVCQAVSCKEGFQIDALTSECVPWV